MSRPASRLIAGCMTGTSLDGLDVSLIEVAGQGLAMTVRWLGSVSQGLGDLADVLGPMAEGRPHAPLDYLRAARQLGELHRDAVSEVCRTYLPAEQRLHMVVAHGQTIWHAPGEGLSWQLFDPEPIARCLNVPVCYNLRQADLIAGGEGAPITPISDWVMFRHPDHDRVIVNLGGVSNLTHLPAGGSPEQVRGADVGPCNLLIDGIVRRLFPEVRYDCDGHLAGQGVIHAEVSELIERKSAIRQSPKRSLGREVFSADWVAQLVDQLRGKWSPADIVASAVDVVARLIARSPLARARQVVLAGGGVRNPVLVERLRAAMTGKTVMLSDELGVPIEARESAGFAVLGALCEDRVPISLPRVTGSDGPGVAGHWVLPGAKT